MIIAIYAQIASVRTATHMVHVRPRHVEPRQKKALQSASAMMDSIEVRQILRTSHVKHVTPTVRLVQHRRLRTMSHVLNVQR